jgi:hypothetical protein
MLRIRTIFHRIWIRISKTYRSRSGYGLFPRNFCCQIILNTAGSWSKKFNIDYLQHLFKRKKLRICHLLRLRSASGSWSDQKAPNPTESANKWPLPSQQGKPLNLRSRTARRVASVKCCCLVSEEEGSRKIKSELSGSCQFPVGALHTERTFPSQSKAYRT